MELGHERDTDEERRGLQCHITGVTCPYCCGDTGEGPSSGCGGRKARGAAGGWSRAVAGQAPGQGWEARGFPGMQSTARRAPHPCTGSPGLWGPLPVPRGAHGAQRCGDCSRSERWPQPVPQGPAGMGLEAACQLAGAFPVPQHSPNPQTVVAGKVLSHEETSAIPVTFRLIFIRSVNGRNVSSVLRSTGIYNCRSPGSAHPPRPSTAGLCWESRCPAAAALRWFTACQEHLCSAHTCRPPCPSIAHTPCTCPHFPASRPAPLSCPE